MNDDDQIQNIKHAADAVAAAAIGGSMLGYLPYIAAALGIVWYLMQMYDWVQKKRNAKRTRRRSTDKVEA